MKKDLWGMSPDFDNRAQLEQDMVRMEPQCGWNPVVLWHNTKETDMNNVRTMALLMLCGSLACVASASDFLPTERECHEASDFIEHAAMSRDNGYSQKTLIQRFDDDIMILSDMHPEKRWFVRSPGATKFLRQALMDVFALKRKPRDQAGAFRTSCMAHVLAISPDDL